MLRGELRVLRGELHVLRRELRVSREQIGGFRGLRGSQDQFGETHELRWELWRDLVDGSILGLLFIIFLTLA